jgi:hypothetical protein
MSKLTAIVFSSVLASTFVTQGLASNLNDEKFERSYQLGKAGNPFELVGFRGLEDTHTWSNQQVAMLKAAVFSDEGRIASMTFNNVTVLAGEGDLSQTLEVLLNGKRAFEPLTITSLTKAHTLSVAFPEDSDGIATISFVLSKINKASDFGIPDPSPLGIALRDVKVTYCKTQQAPTLETASNKDVAEEAAKRAKEQAANAAVSAAEKAQREANNFAKSAQAKIASEAPKTVASVQERAPVVAAKVEKEVTNAVKSAGKKVKKWI